MTSRRTSRGSRVAAAAWAGLLICAAFSECLIVPSLLAVLATAGVVLGSYERALASLLPLAVLAAPLFFVAMVPLVLPTRHATRGKVASAAVLGLTLFAELADNFMYRTFGRHLRDLLRYAEMPDGAEAAGNIGSWLAHAALWGCIALLAVGLWGLLTEALERAPLSRAVASFAAAAGISVVAILASTLWFVPASLVERVRPRIMGSLAFDPSPPVSSEVHHDDPRLAALQRAFEREYARRFAYVFGPPADPAQLATTKPPALPNISLVIAESFRADMLSKERMPRLWEWSKGGLRFERHYSGANHSETGMFSLLFSRSALTYQSTLNAAPATPALCQALRTLGYRCGYFSGHPEIWFRREEFLNSRTMDVFSHDDHGDWNDWDRSALDRAARFLSEGTGRIAITFLMSSHYEYRYPAAYARNLPDTEPRVPWKSMEAKPEEFPANENRYFNVVEYVDDLVTDHLEKLGRANTISVFTGDHGEMLGEDGRFGHGYGFADPYVRVPLVLRGPGVEPGVRGERTVHQDLLPSLLALLGQRPTNAVGHCWFDDSARDSLLIANTKNDFRTADAILFVGDERLSLRFDLEEPRVEVIEFQDAAGRQISPKLVNLEKWTGAFADELDRAGRPLP